jgi:glucose/arabinose dehydrogenase
MFRPVRWLIALCLCIGFFGLIASSAALGPTAVAAADPNCKPGLFQGVSPQQACQPAPKGPQTPAVTTPAPKVADYVDQTIWSGLDRPTAVRFSSDGRVFVAEKSGQIWVYASLTAAAPTLFADLSTEVDDYWDRGLSGLALAPGFPTNPSIYVLYTYDAPPGGAAPVWNDSCPTPPGDTTDGCVVSGRLSRLQLDPNNANIAKGGVTTPDELVLIGNQPGNPLSEQWCQQYPSHSLDDLVFGPDGMLYVSSGDGANFNAADYGQFGGTTGATTPPLPANVANPCGDPPNAAGAADEPPDAQGGALRTQSPRRPAGQPRVLNGTILRVDPSTGQGVSGNPMFNSTDPNAQRILAYGLRNPYRFTFRPGTNEIWIGDVGWSTWEEVNRIADRTAGTATNFGWPCYEGDAQMPDYAGAQLNSCNTLYAAAGANAATAPYYTYKHDQQVDPNDPTCPPYNNPYSVGSSITGAAFYTGSSYLGQEQGAFFFADYSRNCIYEMPATNGQPDATKVRTFIADAPGPVDLEIEPTSGDIFYVGHTDDGQPDSGSIHRIRYNAPAVTSASADPTVSPNVPLSVQFTGAGTATVLPITYSWDFGDGTPLSTQQSPSHTFVQAGVYYARLAVTDANGATALSTPIRINVGNTPPTAGITTPASTLTWSVGTKITFAGTGTDTQDHALPASAYTWTILLHHCTESGSCHIHQIQTLAGITSGSFNAPDHEYPSWLEIQLTVKDSDGLSNTQSVRLDPNTVKLTLASETPGVQLAMGGAAGTAPLTRDVIVGSVNSLAAPSPQTINGVPYYFAGWSDGGAQGHNVTAGTTDATYTSTWRKSPMLTLSTNGGGTVSGAIVGQSLYVPDTPVTLTATPAAGNLFLGWTIDGQFAGFHTPLTLAMGRDYTVAARFAPVPTLPDVPANAPYAAAIARLNAFDTIRGYSDGRIGPNDIAVRAQMAAMIARAMGWDTLNAGNPFTDQGQVDANLWRNVGVLNDKGVAHGYGDGTFRPTAPVLHVQVISFITRAMVAQGYWQPVTTDDPRLYPNVPLASGNRLDLLTYIKYVGGTAIPNRPTSQPWADWDTPASRGWFAQVLDAALSSAFVGYTAP